MDAMIAERITVSGLVSALLLSAASISAVAQTEVDGPPHTTLVPPPFAHTMGIHHARPMHLKLFLGDRTRFDDPQGVTAVKFDSDDDPEAKRDDFQLTLFGVNAGRHEVIYNSSMQTLAVYGREGSGRDQFRSPRGIDATIDGRVYVADTGNGRVVRLRWDPVSRSLAWVGAWEGGAPIDVAADARGQVFAVDRVAGAVIRHRDSLANPDPRPAFPPTGDRWPLPADTSEPLALAIGDSLDRWYSPAHYRLFLVDRNGARLRVLDPRGEVLAEAAPPASGARFGFVDLDYYGNVYVTDGGAHAIHKFDPELRLLTTFPGPDPQSDPLDDPRGIAIWRRFGQVFVAEREGAHYFFIGTDFDPRSGPLEIRAVDAERWSFDLALTESALVTVTFVDAARDTLGVVDVGVVGIGPRGLTWGPEDWSLGPAPGWRSRAVEALVEARPTYSSRRRFSRIRRYDVVWVEALTPPPGRQ